MNVRGLVDAAAVRWIQAGACLCTLALLPGSPQVAQRYVYPKDLVFHVTALGAGTLCLAASRKLSVRTADLVLTAFCLLSLASLYAAENLWLAARVVSLTISAAALYWAARSLARRGFREELLGALVAASAVITLGALLEAHGAAPDLSMPSRAPGGTIGHRNRVAHLLTISLPVWIACAALAGRRWQYWAVSLGTAAITWAVVLTRARAAWLALLVMGLVGLALYAKHDALRLALPAKRMTGVLLLMSLGGVAALTVPNELRWNSSSPYWDSARTLVDYESGSGQVRLLQYRNTFRMATDHLLAGVGPGNWGIAYLRYAPPSDPLANQSGMQSPGVPQADWLPLVAERGLSCLLLAALFAFLHARGARRDLDSRAAASSAGAFAMLLALSGMFVIGSLDTLFSMPVSLLFGSLVLGTLKSEDERTLDLPLTHARAVRALLTLVAAASVPIVGYSARQVWAASHYAGESPTVEGLSRAVRASPGDYVARMKLASLLVGRGECEAAARHLAEAKRLFPTSPAPDDLGARCPRTIVAE